MPSCAQIRILGKEVRYLRFQSNRTETPRIRLDLEEIKIPRKFVFANEIYFVFSLPIPPAAYSRVSTFFQEFHLEIPLKREAGECVEIALDNRPHSCELLLCQQVLIL